MLPPMISWKAQRLFACRDATGFRGPLQDRLLPA